MGLTSKQDVSANAILHREAPLLKLVHFLAKVQLIIHDEQDEEIPVSDALRLEEANEKSKLVLTRGAGHQKILINREMLRAVKDFLLE